MLSVADWHIFVAADLRSLRYSNRLLFIEKPNLCRTVPNVNQLTSYYQHSINWTENRVAHYRLRFVSPWGASLLDSRSMTEVYVSWSDLLQDWHFSCDKNICTGRWFIVWLEMGILYILNLTEAYIEPRCVAHARDVEGESSSCHFCGLYEVQWCEASIVRN